MLNQRERIDYGPRNREKYVMKLKKSNSKFD